ncbi:MAG: class I tRNA ligase family protein [Desulfobacterales bacterium]
MTDLDKLPCIRFRNWIDRCLNAYDSFDFHVIYHSLYNYCTVSLSAFYLDILKDRLYTSNPESLPAGAPRPLCTNHCGCHWGLHGPDPAVYL